MNVILNTPLSFTISSAKLVVEDEGRGTIEFTLLDQPVRLNLSSTDYDYDTIFAVNDRVKLLQSFGQFDINTTGTLIGIIADDTEDLADVLFDVIFPDQIYKPVEAHVISQALSLLVRVPLRYLQKI